MASSQREEAEALRVLVVDDYPDGADTLAEVIALLGYRAEVAYASEQALAIAEKFEPRVVLLDLGMPRMSGFELAARLRQTYGPELALIALTGFNGQKERERAKAAGFLDYFLKPVDIAVLTSLLGRLQSGS
jgi:CheY-like chemotaxis protein